MALTGNQRRFLRGLGHHLKPILHVGHAGVTPAVIKQLRGALHDHELVKVKLAETVEDRTAAAEELSTGTRAEVAQIMGRTVLLFKPRDKEPEIVLPQPRKGPATTPSKKKGAAAAAALATDDDGDDALSPEAAKDDGEE